MMVTDMKLHFNITYNTNWQESSSDEYNTMIDELEFFVSISRFESSYLFKSKCWSSAGLFAISYHFKLEGDY